MESFFTKVLKSPRSYDFLKQIELDDIVDNMNNFQQSIVNEIAPICKFQTSAGVLQPSHQGNVLYGGSNVNMASFKNDLRKVLNSHKERMDKH